MRVNLAMKHSNNLLNRVMLKHSDILLSKATIIKYLEDKHFKCVVAIKKDALYEYKLDDVIVEISYKTVLIYKDCKLIHVFKLKKLKRLDEITKYIDKLFAIIQLESILIR